MRRVSRRRAVLAVAALALVGLAAVTAIRFEHSRDLERAAARFEEVVGPLEFEAYRPDPVPDARNAAVPIREALDHIESRSGEEASTEATGWLRMQNRRAAEDWSDEERRRARAVVATRGATLGNLHRAAGRPDSSFGLDYSAALMMEIPNLLLTLQAGDLLFAEARIAWHEGRTGEAVRAIESLAALSGALEAEAPVIFQLVGHTLEIRQYRALRDGLAAGGLDAAALERLRGCAAERSRVELLRRAAGIEGASLYLVRPGGPYSDALSQELGWRQQIAYRLLGDASVVRGLSYYTRIAREFPGMSHAEARERPGLLEPPSGDRTGLLVDLDRATAILKGTEALARLARLALDVAAAGSEEGTLPPGPPDTPEASPGPFTGKRPTYERREDGSVVLTLPGAEELWRRVNSREILPEEEPLFTWRVPAPGTGPVAAP